MLTIEQCWNRHAGQTCLIVGVAPNLKLTPPPLFPFPSFGVNTIYKQTEWDWKPTYYVGVDERLRIEDGDAVCSVYSDVPKFFPSPDWDKQQGKNILRFVHRQGGNLYVGGQLANHKEALVKHGITYHYIMGAVFQIAWHMGFTTMLIIGMQHNPQDTRAHFWGQDTAAVVQPQEPWFDEYRTFRGMMTNVTMLNISPDTYVPEEVIPRDDWQKWIIQ